MLLCGTEASTDEGEADLTKTTSEKGKTLPAKTAAEVGWHVSRYNVSAKVQGVDGLVIYNTLRRTCAAFSSLELFAMSALDVFPESNPFIAHLARYGVIVNYDELEALEAEGRMASGMPNGDTVSVTICPTMACNLESACAPRIATTLRRSFARCMRGAVTSRGAPERRG